MADSDLSFSSSHSQSDSEHSEAEIELFFETGGILPWRFEPPGRPREARDEIPVHEEENRRSNTDWCMCENCQRMERERECLCCMEIAEIVRKNSEAVEMGDCQVPPACITQHPGFQAVCLNIWVLQCAWYQYKQQYSKSYDGPEHKLYRHVAYRQLVRWCWGVLGKKIRVTLPSCAVCCIRAHFPPPGLEEDFVFEGFHFPDE